MGEDFGMDFGDFLDVILYKLIFLGEPLSLCESGTWVARVGGSLYEHRVAGVGEGSHGSYARVEGSLYDRHPSFSAGPSAANRTQLAQGLKSYYSKFWNFEGESIYF